MEIKITPGTIDIVSVSGSVDALTASELTVKFSEHIHDGHPNIVCDFSGVDFMSSAGLRAILASVKEARSSGGDFRLAAPQPAIEKVLKMAGFNNIVKVFPTVEAALASFS